MLHAIALNSFNGVLHQVTKQFTTQLANNQFVSGGFSLMLIGGVIATLRKIPGQLIKWVRNRALLTIEITSNDQAFQWVRQWIGKRNNSRYLLASIASSVSDNAPKAIGESENKPTFCLSPLGIFFVRFNGRRIIGWIHRERLQQGGYCETFTLQCFRGKPTLFVELLEESYKESKALNASTVEVYFPDDYSWQLADRKAGRSLASLTFADDIGQRLIDDARAFLDRRVWYAQTGIPFRRGYLLEGPPGNGKSSLVHAMATELGTNINVANLTNFTDDNQLMKVMSRVPKGHIVLLEDIDAIFKNRDGANGVKVTFSGLLNVIDGVCAQDGRFLVMTTNHKELLDAALIRPGRADVHLRIENASSEQIATMFIKFYGEQYACLADEFAASLFDQNLSMAAVQGILLSCPTAHEAIGYTSGLSPAPARLQLSA